MSSVNSLPTASTLEVHQNGGSNCLESRPAASKWITRRAIFVWLLVIVAALYGLLCIWTGRKAAQLKIYCTLEDVSAKILTADGRPVTRTLRMPLLEPLELTPGDYILRAHVGLGLSEDIQLTLDPGSKNSINLVMDRPEVFRMQADGATFSYEADSWGQYLFGLSTTKLTFAVRPESGSWSDPIEVDFLKLENIPGAERLLSPPPRGNVAPDLYFLPSENQSPKSATIVEQTSMRPCCLVLFRAEEFAVALDRTGRVVWSENFLLGSIGTTQHARALVDLNGDGLLDPVIAVSTPMGLQLAAISSTDGSTLWRQVIPGVGVSVATNTPSEQTTSSDSELLDAFPYQKIALIQTREGLKVAFLDARSLSLLTFLHGVDLEKIELPLSASEGLAAVDVNSDGISELVVAGQSNHETLDIVFCADSKVRWTSQIATTLPASLAEWANAVTRPANGVDLNSDGIEDMLIPTAESILAVDGASGLQIWESCRIPNVTKSLKNFEIGPDINGDGCRDAIVFSINQRSSQPSTATCHADCISGKDGSRLWHQVTYSTDLVPRREIFPELVATYSYDTQACRPRIGVRLKIASPNVWAQSVSLIVNVCPYTGSVLDELTVRGMFGMGKKANRIDSIIGFRTHFGPEHAPWTYYHDIGQVQVIPAPPVWRRSFPLKKVSDLDHDGMLDFVELRLTGISGISAASGQAIWTRSFTWGPGFENGRIEDVFGQMPVVFSSASLESSQFRKRDSSLEAWDFDFDGIDDLVVIEPRNRQGHLQVSVVSGQSGRTICTCPVNCNQEALELSGQFASAVCSDLTGDRTPDVFLAMQMLGDMREPVSRRSWGTINATSVGVIDGKSGRITWTRVLAYSNPNQNWPSLTEDQDGDRIPEVVYPQSGNAYLWSGRDGNELRPPISQFPAFGEFIEFLNKSGERILIAVDANWKQGNKYAVAVNTATWSLIWRHEVPGLDMTSPEIALLDSEEPLIVAATGRDHLSLIDREGVKTMQIPGLEARKANPLVIFAIPDQTGDGVSEFAVGTNKIEIRDPMNNCQVIRTVKSIRNILPYATARPLGTQEKLAYIPSDDRMSEIFDLESGEQLGTIAASGHVGSEWIEGHSDAHGGVLGGRPYTERIWPIHFSDHRRQAAVDDWIESGLKKIATRTRAQPTDSRFLREPPWEAFLARNYNRERWMQFWLVVGFKSLFLIAIPIALLAKFSQKSKFSLRMLLIFPLVVLGALVGGTGNHTWIYELGGYSHWKLAFVLSGLVPMWLLSIRVVDWVVHFQAGRLLAAIVSAGIFAVGIAIAHINYDMTVAKLASGEHYSYSGWYWPFLPGWLLVSWLWLLALISNTCLGWFINGHRKRKRLRANLAG